MQTARRLPADPSAEPRRPILTVVHQPTSSCGRVGAMLRARGHALDRRCPMHGDPLPGNLSDHAGVVVFGGPMSANDDHLPGIRAELDLLERAMTAEVPTLGICLGGQMMARVLGGRVRPRDDARVEVGYYPVWGTEAGRRHGLFDGEMGVYQWHKEGFDLPPGATLLARGLGYPNQAFAVGTRAYGLQFHPEVTHEMMMRWTTKAAHMLTWPGAQGAPAHHAGRHRHDAALGRWLARFLDHWLPAA
ncbi:glutamine amidotransferase-related protein [Roseospira goensis]|uniref:GMP synthase (Glutamine-hydrolyzing) n=1 Tax=Roseospira goensis TaxID=391922 RepID=A0A7W6WMR1_9PROT|nr:gamma-glutamyl-gamma-aminobutyrate hydrolase family protein [Roseospira goensis]MBB4287762.1 GMP synthase (glutamine-hydrolyzing) [Roseospira goensis]